MPHAHSSLQAHVVGPKDIKIAYWAAASVIVSLLLVKHLATAGIGGTVGYTLVAGLQLYLPLYITRKWMNANDFLGISRKAIKQDFILVCLLTLFIIPIFAIGHHFYQTIFFHKSFALQLPNDIGEMVLTHTLAVALPEELFYRGYLQAIFEHRWPPKFRILNAKMGKAVVFVAIIFAVGHFVGEYNPLRLGPFFPSFIFSWLRARNNSIWGAVGFHAIANISGDFLFAFYH